jgi:hypothetical protein
VNRAGDASRAFSLPAGPQAGASRQVEPSAVSHRDLCCSVPGHGPKSLNMLRLSAYPTQPCADSKHGEIAQSENAQQFGEITVGAALALWLSIALPVRGIAHDFHRNHLRANRESFFLHPWRDLHVRGAFSLARAGPARPHRPPNRGLPARCIRPSTGCNNACDGSGPRTRPSSDTPEQSPRRVAHRYDHSGGTGSLITVPVT